MYVDDARFRAGSTWPGSASASASTSTSRIRFRRSIDDLRHSLYERLAPIANAWQSRLRSSRPAFPKTLDAFLETCHAAGQRRPTPLLLSYPTGGHNCLHQDIYGDVAFPLQVVFGLSRPGEDYEGGELLFVEQRPRAQSRGFAVRVEQGAAWSSPPASGRSPGSRGDYRVALRHGVSTDHRGSRMALGIIFHDGDGERQGQGAGSVRVRVRCRVRVGSRPGAGPAECGLGVGRVRMRRCDARPRLDHLAASLLVACCASRQAPGASGPRKVFISVDMEGISGVVQPAQLGPDGFEYQRAREWMTGEVNAAIAGIRASGPAEIVVCDSHGNGQSVLIDKLPDDVRIVRGFPRPLEMMQGHRRVVRRGGVHRLPRERVDARTPCAATRFRAPGCSASS